MMHQRAKDYVPIAGSMTKATFCDRFGHPFLFGREVLEEEFRFQTLVTSGESMESRPQPPPGDQLRIRHWVIAVKKPDGAAGKDRIFLGRAESNDISVPHRTVSKLHAYFTRDPDITTRWFVVDTGSANGTKVRGERIAARARIDLVDGDSIAFGRCLFQWMTAGSLYDRVKAMADSYLE